MDWECPLCLDCEPFATPKGLATHMVAWHDEWLATNQVPWLPWPGPSTGPL